MAKITFAEFLKDSNILLVDFDDNGEGIQILVNSGKGFQTCEDWKVNYPSYRSYLVSKLDIDYVRGTVSIGIVKPYIMDNHK